MLMVAALSAATIFVKSVTGHRTDQMAECYAREPIRSRSTAWDEVLAAKERVKRLRRAK